MTWAQIAVTYGVAIASFLLGWIVCALLSVGRDAERDDQEPPSFI